MQRINLEMEELLSKGRVRKILKALKVLYSLTRWLSYDLYNSFVFTCLHLIKLII